jgi:protein SCO1/2
VIAAWAAAHAEVPPAAVAAAGLDDRLGAQVPLDLVFVDQEGRAVPLREVVDGPTALVLAWYRCPMLCGVVGGGLAAALGDGHAVTVSFDPDDRPEDAARVRARDGAGWPYLVGDAGSIGALTGALGFRAVRDPGGQWAHPAVVFVLTPDGRLASRLPGPRPDQDLLRAALLDAGRGHVAASGGWIDTCFRWDPAARVHGGSLLSLLRAGAAAIAAALAIGVARLVRR